MARKLAPLVSPSLLLRHQLAAFAATVVDFSLMIFFVEVYGLSPPRATVCSALLGGVTNFTLSRVWAYRQRHGGSVPSQGLRYALVSAGGAILNAMLLALALRAGASSYAAARVLVAILVSVFYTYPLHTRVVFRVRA